VNVYLVRHAKAGDREAWTEPDELRPLTKKGRRQAEALVGSFRGLELARVVSSPYVRCVQTVRPLALDRGLPVELSGALVEGARTDQAMELLRAMASEPSVLCSHGDVIPALVLSLAESGTKLVGERDWRKGATWVLKCRAGKFVRAHSLAPPLVS
jgi:phosphohistidine phosphatase SixA